MRVFLTVYCLARDGRRIQVHLCENHKKKNRRYIWQMFSSGEIVVRRVQIWAQKLREKIPIFYTRRRPPSRAQV